MADRESEIIAKIASGVSGLNARAWDRLGNGDPFTSHAFLAALEDFIALATEPDGLLRRSSSRMTPRI